MKSKLYYVVTIFLSVFLLNVAHAGENVDQESFSASQSPCWFVNKSMEYPFLGLPQQRFGTLTYKSKLDYVNSFIYFALLPMTSECIVNYDFNLSILSAPLFALTNTLNGFLHIHYLCRKFNILMNDELSPEDYCLTDPNEIKEYLLSIQQCKGEFGNICDCNNSLKKLSKQNDDNSDNLSIEQDYKFMPIKVPDKIQKNLYKKTIVSNKDYYYSALTTIFFTYLASVLYYRSLTAPLHIHTLLRIELAIWYNWYLLYSGNKKHQDRLMQKVYRLYENFVINVHDYQLILDTANKHLQNLVIDD